MARTAINALLLIISLVIGGGIALYLLPQLIPFLDEQTRIIIAIVLSIFTFISLYFMSKGQGS